MNFLVNQGKVSIQDEQPSRFAWECAGFSNENLKAQETAQPQANPDKWSPYATNSYLPFRVLSKAGLHSYSAQHLPYLPGPILPHKCSSASIRHSLIDKGMKRPFRACLSVGKGTVSFFPLPVWSPSEAQAFWPTQLNQSDHGRNGTRSPRCLEKQGVPQ